MVDDTNRPFFDGLYDSYPGDDDLERFTREDITDPKCYLCGLRKSSYTSRSIDPPRCVESTARIETEDGIYTITHYSHFWDRLVGSVQRQHRDETSERNDSAGVRQTRMF